MTGSRQRHYGRESEEGDTARGKRDRQRGRQREKYEEEEDKSLLCCRGDFHTHFRMQLCPRHLPTVSDVYSQVLENGFLHLRDTTDSI